MGTESHITTTLATPTILRIEDSKGTSIPNPGTTEDTVLNLSGTAGLNSVVSLFDHSMRVGTASVVEPGIWKISSLVAAVGPHSLTIRAPDGASSVPPWVVTVTEASVKPEITRIEDFAGKEIPPGESTFDTAVTLKGSAVAGETVELFQDGLSKGHVLVNESSKWALAVTALVVGAHNFQARGDYGSGPVSAVRSVTVAASALTIDSVIDAAGDEIPPGGSTLRNSVTLSGTAAASQRVEILDDYQSIGEAPVTADGGWTCTLSDLTPKTYRIGVKALYGNFPVALFIFSMRNQGVEDFEGWPIGELPVNQDVLFSDGLIGFFLPGRFNTSIAGRDNVPGFGVRTLYVFNNTDARFEFDWSINIFKFSYSYVRVATNRVVFYDDEAEEIESYSLVVDDSLEPTVAEITLSRPCTHCVFYIDQGAWTGVELDNFEWTYVPQTQMELCEL